MIRRNILGFLLTAAFLTGCTNHIDILSVTREAMTANDAENIEKMSGQESEGWEKFSLSIARDQIKKAADVQSTLYIDIFDCKNREKNFPSIAYLNTIPLDEGHRPAASALENSPEVVTIHGYARSRFMNGLESACLQIIGGSYLGTRTRSDIEMLR